MARADTTRDSGQSGVSMLGIYLNDHLAGATAGTELAHRMARSHGDDGKNGATLRRLAAEIAQDRAALLDIMTALGIKVRRYKVSAAWIGEKAPAEVQRPHPHPVTPQRPGRTGNAAARRGGQGRRLAYPADPG